MRPTRTNCGFTPDVVNLNNLNASVTRNFVGSGSGCAAAPAVTPITRKYMSLIYNPIIESQGGARLITLQGWNNPDTLATQFVADVATGSNNLATYVAGPRVELDAYPVKEDGFQYTDASFMACLANVANCHKPGQEMGFGYAIDYLAMLNSQNVCARFNAGEFDELWMFGAPFMGFWEANQAGTQAINTNGPIVVGSTCQGRLNIFGFAYHVGVGEHAARLRTPHRRDHVQPATERRQPVRAVHAQRSAEPRTGPVRQDALHADQRLRIRLQQHAQRDVELRRLAELPEPNRRHGDHQLQRLGLRRARVSDLVDATPAARRGRRLRRQLE